MSVCLLGALDEDGDGLRVLALLHKGELVLPEHVLVHDAGVPKDGLVHVHGVHGSPAASQGQTFHVAPKNILKKVPRVQSVCVT